MSELKERDARELVINNLAYFPNVESMRVYLKYEADAYIRKLDNYHKYKRCLDKAERCRITAWFYGNAVSKVLNKDITDPDRQKVFRRLKHHKKWHLRWLELAKKFKEAKQ